MTHKNYTLIKFYQRQPRLPFMYYVWDSHGRVECGPQSLKYLLRGPLQKKFTNISARRLFNPGKKSRELEL